MFSHARFAQASTQEDDGQRGSERQEAQAGCGKEAKPSPAKSNRDAKL
jgi:hypothetical protein